MARTNGHSSLLPLPSSLSPSSSTTHHSSPTTNFPPPSSLFPSSSTTNHSSPITNHAKRSFAKISSFAPASIGNISVGFDVLGAAVAPID